MLNIPSREQICKLKAEQHISLQEARLRVKYKLHVNINPSRSQSLNLRANTSQTSQATVNSSSLTQLIQSEARDETSSANTVEGQSTQPSVAEESASSLTQESG